MGHGSSSDVKVHCTESDSQAQRHVVRDIVMALPAMSAGSEEPALTTEVEGAELAHPRVGKMTSTTSSQA